MSGPEVDKPSQEKSVFWFTATKKFTLPSERKEESESGTSEASPSSSANEEGEGSGKWLIFEPRKDVDAAWAKIKIATEKGDLGFASKVSTRKDKPAAIGGGRDNHVICVYTTGEARDKTRIRDALYLLGFVRHLHYKSDMATLRGEYSAHCAQ